MEKEKLEKKFILFDLDGTITDPKVGITRCVQYALNHFGIDEDTNNLLDYIGPPLVESFQKFHGLNEAQAEEAVIKYRERFKDIGIFENDVIEGITDVFEKLKQKDMILCLATSKPQEFAVRIMQHFDFSKYFTIEMGSGMNGERKYKSDVIEAVFDELISRYKKGEFEGLEYNVSDDISILNAIKADSVMIGDRKHDIEGAKIVHIESVGVRFGYARDGELEEAGADYIVSTPQELENLLIG